MKTKLYNWIFVLMGLLIMQACTEDITLDMPTGEEKLVVEGTIENGQPPFVVLTKTVPYFSETSLANLNNIYVSGAKVKVSDGIKTVDLLEINLADLPDSLKQLVSRMLNINLEGISGFNYVFYTSIEMMGEFGKTYELTIDQGEYHLHATTSILPGIPIDSLWYELPPEAKVDSFYVLKTMFHDPPTQVNYYRYFTSRNDETFYSNRFSSVFDDKLINGQMITTPVSRGEPRTAKFDPEHYGLFERGDTITLKLSSIDEAIYNFWLTFENDQLRGGPFASPIQIESNIDGGLGYWCGYGSSTKQIIIPE